MTTEYAWKFLWWDANVSTPQRKTTIFLDRDPDWIRLTAWVFTVSAEASLAEVDAQFREARMDISMANWVLIRCCRVFRTCFCPPLEEQWVDGQRQFVCRFPPHFAIPLSQLRLQPLNIVMQNSAGIEESWLTGVGWKDPAISSLTSFQLPAKPGFGHVETNQLLFFSGTERSFRKQRYFVLSDSWRSLTQSIDTWKVHKTYYRLLHPDDQWVTLCETSNEPIDEKTRAKIRWESDLHSEPLLFPAQDDVHSSSSKDQTNVMFFIPFRECSSDGFAVSLSMSTFERNGDIWWLQK